MVIDAGKGIESQTLKLFEICKKRGVPIFTFMNKMDREALPPLELIDQLEKVLGIHAFPVNWPIEHGPFFKGVYDRLSKEVHLFEKVPGGAYRAPVSVVGIADKTIKETMIEEIYQKFVEEIELLEYAHPGFDPNEVLKGHTTPVFFGSAANNFGVELLLKGFLNYSSSPLARKTKSGELLPLDHSSFSGFIFKVQTNMNPLHRDRMVFARVCSGRFQRDSKIFHTRLGKEIRLSSSHNVFGREREVVSEAYPGDIIGFVTNTEFRVGDTISEDPKVIFERIPRFAPECFAYISNVTVSIYKSFRKGLEHLIAEDIVQTFSVKTNKSNNLLLGAVGPLQFEVLQYRLKEEYGAQSKLEAMPWVAMRWLETNMDEELLEKIIPYDASWGYDVQNRQVMFFESAWSLKHFQNNKSEITLLDSLTE
jgi:peptide chain release factor 3